MERERDFSRKRATMPPYLFCNPFSSPGEAKMTRSFKLLSEGEKAHEEVQRVIESQGPHYEIRFPSADLVVVEFAEGSDFEADVIESRLRSLGFIV